MTTITPVLDQLSDRDLLTAVQRAAQDERQATAHLIALLLELDTRRLYLAEGCSSLFTYCTQVLHLSEHAAYGRIEAARVARRVPVVLDRLTDGSLTLTTLCLLAPLLTAANHLELIDAARHKSKREVEHLVAERRPRPDVAAVVRKVPERKPMLLTSAPEATDRPIEPPVCAPAASAAASCAPAAAIRRPAEIKPLASARYKVQFTVDGDTYEKLRRAQDLLRHAIPSGDPAQIFSRALGLLLSDLERKKLAATERPREPRAAASSSRYIPAAMKRAVWRRDGPHARQPRVGPATKVVARSRARTDAVAKRDSSSCTTWCRMPRVVKHPSRTWNCAAGRTTNTRRTSISGRGISSTCPDRAHDAKLVGPVNRLRRGVFVQRRRLPGPKTR